MKIIKGNLIDIHQREVYGAQIEIENDSIVNIIRDDVFYEKYICPGLIDAHIHIESSMLIPSEFAGIAIKNGTVATVSDPHEIGNVLGLDGINFMIENAASVPLKFYWTAPSCVPATAFESSGAQLSAQDLEPLLARPEIVALGEMMNYPAVINDDPLVLAKIAMAKKYDKPIDGHIPGVSGPPLAKYVSAGITTDHECFLLEEALEKISLGMKILIREGSAARNFAALHPLINSHNNQVIFCTDDSHPDELYNYGHINKLIKRGLSLGYNIFDLLTCCTKNVVEHYKLDVGLLRIGDKADFILIDNLIDFNVLENYIDGQQVFAEQGLNFISAKPPVINNFKRRKIEEKELRIDAKTTKVKVIKALDGQLITKSKQVELKIINGALVPDIANDILKVTVINRYQAKSTPALGFINGFKLKKGAIASSIAHDSHNIIALGCSDKEITCAVNAIINNQGGIAVANDDDTVALPLKYAGLMSASPAETVADLYQNLSQKVGDLGCEQKAPFMTLAFMALLVIPSLKIGDKGLFDVKEFNLTNLFL